MYLDTYFDKGSEGPENAGNKPANQSFEQTPDHDRGVLSSPRPALLNSLMARTLRAAPVSLIRSGVRPMTEGE
jgi:hypothetical protein